MPTGLEARRSWADGFERRRLLMELRGNVCRRPELVGRTLSTRLRGPAGPEAGRILAGRTGQDPGAAACVTRRGRSDSGGRRSR